MKARQRFPWIPVGAGAAVLVVGVVAWLQIPSAPSALKTGASMPALDFTRFDAKGGAGVLAERLAAYDPTPLFLPTAMNSGQTVFASEERRDTNGPFADLPPRLVFDENKADLDFPPIVAVPASPVKGLALADRLEVPLVLGRTDGVGGKLPERAGVLEAVRVGDNQVVLTLPLPETADSPKGDWQPLELLGVVSRFGQVGGLMVTTSSGVDAVDDYFSTRLTQIVRVGERLPSGFYTFRIGP